MNCKYNYDLFQKRLKSSRGIPLDMLEKGKQESLANALERAYNREIVINDNTGKEFMSLISRIDTQPSIEKKSFSTLISNNCSIGDSIYWKRQNTHWLITEVEETEKSIFQAYIELALTNLKWLNPISGEEYSAWVCQKGPEETTIPNGVKGGIFYDQANNSLYFKISKHCKGIEILQRYKEVICNNKKWRIEVINDLTKKDIITLQLLEKPINSETDDLTNQIADGKLSFNYLLSCSLDNLQNIKLNSELELNYTLYHNEENINGLISNVETKNCIYESNKIKFNTIGQAIIKIIYPELNKEFLYYIEVEEDSNENIIYITGPNILTAMTYGEYYLNNIVNGKKEILNGKWEYDRNYFTIIKNENIYIKLRAKNKIGSTILKYKDNNNEYIINIQIKPL